MGTLEWESGAALPVAGEGAAAALGGYVWLTAVVGTGASPQTLYRYNPAADVWASDFATVPTVQGWGAFAAVGGKLYLTGGWDSSDAALCQNVYCYDPGLNLWSAKAAMRDSSTGLQVRLYSHTMVAGADGKLYVFGGNNEFGGGISSGVYCYDPVANTWTTKTSMSFGYTRAAGTLGPDGKIYLFGGDTSAVGENTTSWCYDPVANTMTAKHAMPHGLNSFGAALGGDGLIYVFGGNSDAGSGGPTAAVYAYDPVADSFTAAASMPAAVGGLACASDGHLYAVGGADGAAHYVTSTYVGVLNRPPTAVALTSPANGAILDRTIDQTFMWPFADPDAGDSCSASDLAFTGTASSTVNVGNPSRSYTIPAGTFAAGSYQVAVRNYDSQGLVGPYGAQLSFTMADPSAAPTITAPTSGGSVDFDDTLTWAVATQYAYQARRVADADDGTADESEVYSDTGMVLSSGARSADLTFDVNGRYEHVQVRVWQTSTQPPSDWVDVRVHVQWIPPNAPTGSMLAFDQSGAGGKANALRISWTTAAGEGDTPDAAYVDVYVSEDGGLSFERKATQQLVNGYYDYLTPASGASIVAYLDAFSVDGTRQSSEQIGIATIGPAPADDTNVPVIFGGTA